MGIRQLDRFIREDLPNGIFKVSIEDEIRNYHETSNIPNASAPVIVIDLMSLYNPICELDLPGLLCGGRYNQIATMLECFFSRLKEFGAELFFYRDGPVQQSKTTTWLKRQNQKYWNTMKIIDAIERGKYPINDLGRRFRNIIPAITDYPYELIAKRFGTVHTAMNRECDQELAAFATSVQALAVISNDTDFMIFEGSWRFWSSKDINFQNFTTCEYNRRALIEKLQISYKQMALFATLGGNDVVQYEEMKDFHTSLGPNNRKFYNLADFVRNLPGVENEREWVENCIKKIFTSSENDIRQRIQKSLDFYDLSYYQESANNTANADDLLEMTSSLSFVYQVLTGRPVRLILNFQDLRLPRLGAKFPSIAIKVMARQIGIILYHQQNNRRNWEVLIKTQHDVDYSLQNFPIVFPDVVPPPVDQLLSKDEKEQANLQETKMQLLCWTTSDTLNHQTLQHIPEPYLLTVITLYCLIENETINLFEADLLLYITFMVNTRNYDIRTIPYPSQLIAGAMHLAFLFTAMHKLIKLSARSFRLLIGDASLGPHFDGLLLQQLYKTWKQGRGNLEPIKDWRIYANLRVR
ncbi:uncharacterized protein LOC128737480 [Sabethes cyaneus]|uniref:uncharacterized protein LOC128737480 n=1 Tax=Sabethes cyaneus TaxID=53552 RepID=UPI00237E30E3|nr:uncharacterized protein LOC128737480 [Sabethes cyaneus]